MRLVRGVLCSLFLFSLLACDGEQEFLSSVQAGGGAISVDGASAVTLNLPIMSTTNVGGTLTVTLMGNYFNASNQVETVTIVLSVPNNAFNFPITITAPNSSLTETISGFTTNSITDGTVTIVEAGPGGLQGQFSATFTDAAMNTREVSNGTFVANY